MRQLPPLNAIRAFEAAGRHLSFTKAADELNVTPAAISQQVRHLEDFLGVPLFRRLTRALLLTEAGQIALPALTDGFDKLLEGVKRIQAHNEGGILTVSAAPTFATRWLVRRLPKFEKRHPDVRIRIDPTIQVIDFQRENVDVAIRFGDGNYPGMRSDHLMTEKISPVCCPGLMHGATALRSPEDLRHHPLLHVDWGPVQRTQPDWAMWLMSAGTTSVDPSHGPVFTNEIMAVESALEGNGVALVNRKFVANDVAAGRLAWPFELTLETDFSYFVICPERTADMPKNLAFRQWILEEARLEETM